MCECCRHKSYVQRFDFKLPSYLKHTHECDLCKFLPEFKSSLNTVNSNKSYLGS